MVGLSFYVGTLQAKEQGSGITLSCTDEVLQGLRIPSGGPTMPASAVLGVSTDTVETVPATTPQGAYAGSRNGTKYYTPGCSGLSRIKAENIIYFSSKEDAELQGYTAASC